MKESEPLLPKAADNFGLLKEEPEATVAIKEDTEAEITEELEISVDDLLEDFLVRAWLSWDAPNVSREFRLCVPPAQEPRGLFMLMWADDGKAFPNRDGPGDPLALVGSFVTSRRRFHSLPFQGVSSNISTFCWCMPSPWG